MHIAPSFISRRNLIRSAALLPPLLCAGGLYAAPASSSSRLLVVFMRGAYDALSIVAPTRNSFYQEARPSLALAPPDSGAANAALPLDSDWSLHPALKDSIMPMWQAKQIAFVPFAGTEDMSRSHFETQNSIELGQSLDGSRDFKSGFLGRLAGVLNRGQPISFTNQIPLCFLGGPQVPNINPSGVSAKPVFDSRQQALIASMYENQQVAGTDLGSVIREGFTVDQQVRDTLETGAANGGMGAVSPGGFERKARHIGQLMRDHYNLAFVDVGGWDTHVSQGSVEGTLARHITQLGNGLAGFAQEIGPTAWKNTTVVVVSEFGRTFRENGNKGTDHGHGSTYWVLGGNVAGGQIVGEQVALSEKTLNQGRDLPVLTDYRAMLGNIFARQFGLSRDQIETIFPGAGTVDLKLI